MEAKLREKILREWLNQASPEVTSLIEISFKAGIKRVAELAVKNDILCSQEIAKKNGCIAWLYRQRLS